MERGESNAGYDIAGEMLRLAKQHNDPALLVPANRAMSVTSFELGRFVAAREHAEQVLALYDPSRHRALAAPYGFDQRTVALGSLARALLSLGYPDQARQRIGAAVAEARRLAHPASLAQSFMFSCFLCRLARDATGQAEAAEMLIAAAAEHDMPHFHAMGRLMRGGSLLQIGRAKDALIEIGQAETALRATGRPLRTKLLLAEAHVALGRPVSIPDLLGELAGLEAGPGYWSKATDYWRVGRLLLSLPEPDEAKAEACFRRAIEVAREQGAKTWELRAATSLARLWADQGQRSQARDLLAPIYGWFTEGFDTADLKDAKALLDILG
jgi:predicted ATPase